MGHALCNVRMGGGASNICLFVPRLIIPAEVYATDLSESFMPGSNHPVAVVAPGRERGRPGAEMLHGKFSWGGMLDFHLLTFDGIWFFATILTNTAMLQAERRGHTENRNSYSLSITSKTVGVNRNCSFLSKCMFGTHPELHRQ